MPTSKAAVTTDDDAFARLERTVEFRLFGDGAALTLTVPEQVAAKVGDRIIAGILQPGARIGEQELADEFSISRGPVREAIRILEREGLVTVLPRRGAVVASPSAVELRELFEIRAGLFEVVLRKVAQTRPPELSAILRGGVARLQALAGVEHAGGAYAEAVHRLLILTAQFGQNERLARMIKAISLQTLRYSKLGLASIERRQRSAQTWQQAQLAFETGDTEQMVALVRRGAEESAQEAARKLDAEAASV